MNSERVLHCRDFQEFTNLKLFQFCVYILVQIQTHSPWLLTSFSPNLSQRSNACSFALYEHTIFSVPLGFGAIGFQTVRQVSYLRRTESLKMY